MKVMIDDVVLLCTLAIVFTGFTIAFVWTRTEWPEPSDIPLPPALPASMMLPTQPMPEVQL